jgi:hypothetical protein
MAACAIDRQEDVQMLWDVVDCRIFFTHAGCRELEMPIGSKITRNCATLTQWDDSFSSTNPPNYV